LVLEGFVFLLQLVKLVLQVRDFGAVASGDTSKPAIRGHFKTGHRRPTQNT
jgi:hypothetical protein